jgi:6,7-dimethyl-8-ribityllumazine synthase
MTVVEPEISTQTFNIALVVSRFNETITSALYQGALQRLKEYGFSEEQITVVWVPGAVEIPLVAKQLASTGRYSAVACLGCVIQGETKHFDYVCQQVSYGCQKVSLEQDLPVIFGILTTQTVQQAQDRIGGSHGHKGIESIDAAVQMYSIMAQIEQ